MAKRFTDTDIWKSQRWFKKLCPIYKLAWKYITDTCDHAGILKIDFSEFIDDLGIEEFDINEFIKCCNTDFDKKNGKKIIRERIKMVCEGVIWITGFVKFQYESKDMNINPSVPAIYSALTILNGYGTLNEGLDKGYFTLSKPYYKGMLRTKDKDKDKDKDIIDNLVNKESEKQKFFLIGLYEKEFQHAKKNFPSLEKKDFEKWKDFVDVVYKNDLGEIFKFKAINPVDFGKLKFPKEMWVETIKAILATGIKEEHNLYFRIPQFLEIVESKKSKNGHTVKSNVGKTMEFDPL